MGTQQVIKLAETLIAQGVKKARYVTPTCRVGTAEQLGLKLEQLASDTVQIHKSPLSEITSYLQGVSREGKGFIPTFENPNSAFAQYFTNIQNRGVFKPKICIGGLKSYIYKNAETLNVTKEEYYQLVDKICADIQKAVESNPQGLRQEIVENAGKIQRWAEIFSMQHKFSDGKEVFHKFYDEQMFNNAIKEYTQFVEKLTGKKVFIGCPSRMNFNISVIGMLNKPETYKDVDFILLGHGKGSSLITDITHPDTWRFADNDKSIWKYIENVCANGVNGKKGLVFCCETEGLEKAVKAKVINPEEANDIKTFMKGIGRPVENYWDAEHPVKLCESGIRHIIGDVKDVGRIPDSIANEIGGVDFIEHKGMFTLSPVGKPCITKYNINFDKYRVENLV